MPYKDPDARRAAHRTSDRRHRARVLAYRKRQRLEAKWTAYGGELAYLIAEQARDDRTFRFTGSLVRFEPSYLDRRAVRLVA